MRSLVAHPIPPPPSSARTAAAVRSLGSPIDIDVVERIPLLGMSADRRLHARGDATDHRRIVAGRVDGRVDLEHPSPAFAPAGDREDRGAGGLRPAARAPRCSAPGRHRRARRRSGLPPGRRASGRPSGLRRSARNRPRADCRTVKISRPLRWRESATISVIPGDTTGAITVLRCSPRPSDALAAMSQLPKCGSTTIDPWSPTLRCSAPITRKSSSTSAESSGSAHIESTIMRTYSWYERRASAAAAA